MSNLHTIKWGKAEYTVTRKVDLERFDQDTRDRLTAQGVHDKCMDGYAGDLKGLAAKAKRACIKKAVDFHLKALYEGDWSLSREGARVTSLVIGLRRVFMSPRIGWKGKLSTLTSIEDGEKLANELHLKWGAVLKAARKIEATLESTDDEDFSL